jgi:hypothetical protein
MDRNGHLWYLALSGLRRGEIAGLKWSDIDLTEGTLTIARNRVQVGAASVVENEPKTQSCCVAEQYAVSVIGFPADSPADSSRATRSASWDRPTQP